MKKILLISGLLSSIVSLQAAHSQALKNDLEQIQCLMEQLNFDDAQDAIDVIRGQVIDEMLNLRKQLPKKDTERLLQLAKFIVENYTALDLTNKEEDTETLNSFIEMINAAKSKKPEVATWTKECLKQKRQELCSCIYPTKHSDITADNLQELKDILNALQSWQKELQQTVKNLSGQHKKTTQQEIGTVKNFIDKELTLEIKTLKELIGKVEKQICLAQRPVETAAAPSLQPQPRAAKPKKPKAGQTNFLDNAEFNTLMSELSDMKKRLSQNNAIKDFVVEMAQKVSELFISEKNMMKRQQIINGVNQLKNLIVYQSNGMIKPGESIANLNALQLTKELETIRDLMVEYIARINPNQNNQADIDFFINLLPSKQQMYDEILTQIQNIVTKAVAIIGDTKSNADLLPSIRNLLIQAANSYNALFQSLTPSMQLATAIMIQEIYILIIFNENGFIDKNATKNNIQGLKKLSDDLNVIRNLVIAYVESLIPGRNNKAEIDKLFAVLPKSE